jgi:LysR family glycine cleavage system transcriptional activator
MTEIDDPRWPDRSLRIFDTAAREGTFSAAARRLGIGQPAVSHAVARLETSIGGRLFTRSPRGVALTHLGRQLHVAVAAAHDDIDRAVQEAIGAAEDTSISLSVSSSFAGYWLMPRLAGFKRRHPAVDLRVITSDSDDAVGRDDADLWVPLGEVDAPGLERHRLCAERIVPVAAPELAAAILRADDGLRSAPLIHLEERYASRFSWGDWCAIHDPDAPDPGRTGVYRSNDYSLVLQAALDGEGVALGWMHIVSDLVAAGRLRPLGVPLETDRPFHVLTRRSNAPRPAVTAMRRWLQSTMAAHEGT